MMIGAEVTSTNGTSLSRILRKWVKQAGAHPAHFHVFRLKLVPFVRHTDAFSGVVQRDGTIHRLERNDPCGGNDRVLRAAPDGGPGQSPSERAVERRLEGPVAEGAAEEATPTAAEADA